MNLEQEEFLREVPLTAIRAANKNSGRKWDKRPAAYSVCAGWGPTGGHHYAGNRYTGGMEVTDPDPVVEKGNLDEGEYRFWIGMKDPANTWSRCRLCDTVCHSKKDRTRHQKDCGCTTSLIKVYAMVAGEKITRCLFCGQQTYKQRWGVPLCSLTTCWRGWKFDMFFSWLQNAKWVALRKGLITHWKDDDDAN